MSVDHNVVDAVHAASRPIAAFFGSLAILSLLGLGLGLCKAAKNGDESIERNLGERPATGKFPGNDLS